MSTQIRQQVDRASTVASVAVFAAVIVALGAIFIPIPFSPVPITGQTLGILLAANILGPRKATATVLLVLGLAAVGIPVLAGGRGGIGVLFGASGGYFLGWVIVSVVLGLLTSRLSNNQRGLALRLLFNVTFGVFLVYLPGVPWLCYITDRPLSEGIAVGMTPYLLGDVVKAVIAALAAQAILRSYRARYQMGLVKK